MLRGIYTAGSGMIAEGYRTDTIANNLANADTAGYKKDINITKEFNNELIKRINDQADKGEKPPIGRMGFGVINDENFVSHAAGAMKITDNTLDIAIEGPGYFTIETPQGLRYTRAGNFTLNSNQEIVNAEGYRVLGAGNVPLVKIDDELPLTISTDGTVYNGDQEIGLLAIVDFDNKNLLRKQAGTLFVALENANQVPFTGRIHQGSLETSNINIVQEMVNLISSYRAYEINSKAVQSQDQITDRAINEVAKG